MLALLLPAALAAQQPPAVENGHLRVQTLRGSPETTVRSLARSQQPVWIGYSVPSVHSEHSGCCNEGSPAVYALEGNRRQTAGSSNRTEPEGESYLLILLRADGGKVRRIVFVDDRSRLDAGGLPLNWIPNVDPAESVRLLAGLVRGAENLRNSGIAAIALHRTPEADRVLESFLSPSQPEELRKKTVFWLGSARGRRGYEILDRVVRADPSPEVRSQAVFALSISPEPAALSSMIRAAREDASPHVRGQALFWLAQKAQKKIARDAIESAVENDPETQVKKQAVFALSQMPPEQGTPMLIHLAETNRNPEVRKQAMFWLGQSKDPRALQFFEQVLLK